MSKTGPAISRESDMCRERNGSAMPGPPFSSRLETGNENCLALQHSYADSQAAPSRILNGPPGFSVRNRPASRPGWKGVDIFHKPSLLRIVDSGKVRSKKCHFILHGTIQGLHRLDQEIGDIILPQPIHHVRRKKKALGPMLRFVKIRHGIHPGKRCA